MSVVLGELLRAFVLGTGKERQSSSIAAGRAFETGKLRLDTPLCSGMAFYAELGI